jgi:hypothetical protein
VYRIPRRHGLVSARKRRRGREDYIRWQRDAPMELWQMDIVGWAMLVGGEEVTVTAGVDDHSRFCHRPGRGQFARASNHDSRGFHAW